jgi:hypothetical protein
VCPPDGPHDFLGLDPATAEAEPVAKAVAAGFGEGKLGQLRQVDGQADAADRRITDALGAKDAEPEPGGEEDGDSEQAS